MVPQQTAAPRSPWRRGSHPAVPCRAAALSRSTARRHAANALGMARACRDTTMAPCPWQAGTRLEQFWTRETGRQRPGRRGGTAASPMAPAGSDRRVGGISFTVNVIPSTLGLSRALDWRCAVVIAADRERGLLSAFLAHARTPSAWRRATCPTRRPLRRSAASDIREHHAGTGTCAALPVTSFASTRCA